MVHSGVLYISGRRQDPTNVAGPGVAYPLPLLDGPEFARRRKSDWRDNNLKGGEWNVPDSKVTWPELKCIGIRRTRIVNLRWVNMSAYNFVVSGPKFTNNFRSKPKRSFLLKQFTACRYLHLFQKYWRLNSNVFLNKVEFWTFLFFQILRGRCPPNLVHNLSNFACFWFLNVLGEAPRKFGPGL